MGPDSTGPLLDVSPIIPASVDIRTLARYAGLSSGDPLCEPTPRFYRLENLLTLDDDASDAFRSLNVWLEETVRHPSLDLTPHLNFFIVSFPPSFVLFFGVSFVGPLRLDIDSSVMASTKSSRGNLAPFRTLPNIQRHLRRRISGSDRCPPCIISACTLRAHVWLTNRAPRRTSKSSPGTSRG